MSIRFTNEKAFNKALEKFVERTEIAPDVVARKLVFDVFSGVIERTPVDTGWARGNWMISKGSPATGTTPKPSENNVMAAPIISNLPDGKFPIYWIVNNVPYIIPLENGHSKQMGKGYMVRRTLNVIQSNFKKYLEGL